MSIILTNVIAKDKRALGDPNGKLEVNQTLYAHES